MSNAVGRICSETEQKIHTALDGEYCSSCDAAFHVDFLGDEKTFCPRCGRKMRETLDERLERQRRERSEAEKASATRTGRWLVFGSVFTCLLPLAIIVLRWAIGIDKSAYDGSVKFRVSICLLYTSPSPRD